MQLAHNQMNGGSIPSVPTINLGWSVLSCSRSRAISPARSIPMGAPACAVVWDGMGHVHSRRAILTDGCATAARRGSAGSHGTGSRTRNRVIKTQCRFDSCPSDRTRNSRRDGYIKISWTGCANKVHPALLYRRDTCGRIDSLCALRRKSNHNKAVRVRSSLQLHRDLCVLLRVRHSDTQKDSRRLLRRTLDA